MFFLYCCSCCCRRSRGCYRLGNFAAAAGRKYNREHSFESGWYAGARVKVSLGELVAGGRTTDLTLCPSSGTRLESNVRLNCIKTIWASWQTDSLHLSSGNCDFYFRQFTNSCEHETTVLWLLGCSCILFSSIAFQALDDVWVQYKSCQCVAKYCTRMCEKSAIRMRNKTSAQCYRESYKNNFISSMMRLIKIVENED